MISERQRKLAEYYKRQERLLKGYQEVDSYTDLGMLPGNISEVLKKKMNFCSFIDFFWGQKVLFIHLIFVKFGFVSDILKLMNGFFKF